MKDIIGQKVGRYEIKELIGEGAMAKVYRVYDPEIDRSLALKVLKSDFTGDEEYLNRFLREAKAAGALSHNNIVTVFDVGDTNNSPYILMELLSGDDLGQLLEKRKTFTVKDTLIIALQLAKALHYAHKEGVIHRDIKPDNIMILDDAQSIKVADFGIARINEAEEAQKTQVGSVLGTPRYMSPEQALGQDVDGRTDLYSVGVILYEMLTGEKAFDAANIGTLMTQIIQQQPTNLKQAHPELPSGLCQIVQKLLQKKPEKRFQTGAELAKAIGKELAIHNEQEQSHQINKYVPIKIRWTLYMSAIMAFVMLIAVTVVFNIQSSVMSKQALDSGTAFAKFIAIETAVPLLSEDWISLETFIKEASGRQTFEYLVVTDRDGLVRGASDLTLVGKDINEVAFLQNEAESLNFEGSQASSLELENGNTVFNLEVPVLFQDVTVGSIILGLSQDSLDSVKSATGWLMFALALVTTLSVGAILYIFSLLITKPLKLINNSMLQLGEGDLDTRISLQRNDEIGEMFNSFNTMANAIQQTVHPEETSIDITGIDDTGIKQTPEFEAARAKIEAEVKKSEAATKEKTKPAAASNNNNTEVESSEAKEGKTEASTANTQNMSDTDADKTVVVAPKARRRRTAGAKKTTAPKAKATKASASKAANVLIENEDADKTVIASPKSTSPDESKSVPERLASQKAIPKNVASTDEHPDIDYDKTIISPKTLDAVKKTGKE